ncbi:hypothetical protein OG562_35270 [Streptomyces sp. NBC_01275]|uniref:hypothetical protein n=1 Tax=Streptomyces sp. NBC_01275 TaxID=2903807 RepID=UPI002250F8E6|nr:hypothetical protein [Streptomyces sp. NBC_01275]MCX4766148.1 hypothetical protein [Streptomyces sp. NBC_01275]
MTAGWCSRTVRAAMFAAVCVLLAALGHVMMSGSPVPAWTLAAGVAVTGAAGWCLTGRERGLPLVVTVVVAAQTGLHSAFALVQSTAMGGGAGTAATDPGAALQSMGMAHMDMASMDSMDMPHMDMSGLDHLGHATGGGASSYGMLAAHLLAALLCGLWLAYGEKAAFRILRAVAGWLAAPLRLLLLALPAPAERPRNRLRRYGSERVPRLLLVHAITSRGPPSGTAVV